MSSRSPRDIALTQPHQRRCSPRLPVSALERQRRLAQTDFPSPTQMMMMMQQQQQSSSKQLKELNPDLPLTPALSIVSPITPHPSSTTSNGAVGSRRGCCMSLLTLIATTPSLLGACCWPSLVVGLVGGSVTGAARELSQTVSWFVTFGSLLLMWLWTAWNTRMRAMMHDRHVDIYGPLYLYTIASLLILVDPSRHMLENMGAWTGESVDTMRQGCEGEGWNCLSVTGIIMLVATYTGFIFLFIAGLWNANIFSKIGAWMRNRKNRKAEAMKARERELELELELETAASISDTDNEMDERVVHGEPQPGPDGNTQPIAASNNTSRRGFGLGSFGAGLTASFGSMHLRMQPPALFCRKENARVSSSYSTATDAPTINSQDGTGSGNGFHFPSHLDASVLRHVGEYNMAGYSFEVMSPTIPEQVLRVGSNVNNDNDINTSAATGHAAAALNLKSEATGQGSNAQVEELNRAQSAVHSSNANGNPAAADLQPNPASNNYYNSSASSPSSATASEPLSPHSSAASTFHGTSTIKKYLPPAHDSAESLASPQTTSQSADSAPTTGATHSPSTPPRHPTMTMNNNNSGKGLSPTNTNSPSSATSISPNDHSCRSMSSRSSNSGGYHMDRSASPASSVGMPDFCSPLSNIALTPPNVDGNGDAKGVSSKDEDGAVRSSTPPLRKLTTSPPLPSLQCQTALKSCGPSIQYTHQQPSVLSPPRSNRRLKMGD